MQSCTVLYPPPPRLPITGTAKKFSLLNVLNYLVRSFVDRRLRPIDTCIRTCHRWNGWIDRWGCVVCLSIINWRHAGQYITHTRGTQSFVYHLLETYNALVNPTPFFSFFFFLCLFPRLQLWHKSSPHVHISTAELNLMWLGSARLDRTGLDWLADIPRLTIFLFFSFSFHLFSFFHFHFRFHLFTFHRERGWRNSPCRMLVGIVP